MADTWFWGAGLRFVEALLHASPTILVGLIVAGVFQRLLGREGTFKLFGSNSWRSLPQAWVIGMLLPVCSLGVIPVLREMRKAGVSGGAILAFGLTAPLFNPVSVLYGLTLSEPIVILTFSMCSLLIVTVIGVAWDRLFPGTATQTLSLNPVAEGIKRMLAITSAIVREITGPSLLYILVGLFGVAALSLFLPLGSLGTAAEHDDPLAPLFMTLIAIPAYATPMIAMMQLGSMFQHGNSVGAAFALLALGAGANLGLLAWMVHHYGVRRTSIWFAILLGVVVGLAYTVENPLYPHGVDPAGHTHAFDIYCFPFPAGQTNGAEVALRMLQDGMAIHEGASVAMLAVLIALGILLRWADSNGRFEQWLERVPETPPRFDVRVPAPVLGCVALVGLVVVSVVGCFVYYPPPEDVFKEMKIIDTEVQYAVTVKEWETAEYWIPIYDDWTRKLQVGVFLREGELSDYHRMKAQILRDKLELLEHAVHEAEQEEARALSQQVHQAYLRLKAAYLPQQTGL